MESHSTFSPCFSNTSLQIEKKNNFVVLNDQRGNRLLIEMN
jgi:hypothetical protein